MIPIRDQLPTRSFPFVNYLIIVANVLVFAWYGLILPGAGGGDMTDEYGFVPYNFSHAPIQAAPTILSSMFIYHCTRTKNAKGRHMGAPSYL